MLTEPESRVPTVVIVLTVSTAKIVLQAFTHITRVVNRLTAPRINTWLVATRIETLTHVTIETLRARALKPQRCSLADPKVLTRTEGQRLSFGKIV